MSPPACLICRLAAVLWLSILCQAQYEQWGYPEGYPGPAQEHYQPPQLPPDTPKIQLRLTGDKRKHNEGRLEVFYNGEWGTVCDDDFSIHAAQVVCRELGYLEAISWSPASKYGKGEGRIWLDNVHCTGKEKSLALCSSNGFGVSDCKHTEDVGVVCSDKRIPGFKFINSLTNNIESHFPNGISLHRLNRLFSRLRTGTVQELLFSSIFHKHRRNAVVEGIYRRTKLLQIKSTLHQRKHDQNTSRWLDSVVSYLNTTKGILRYLFCHKKKFPVMFHKYCMNSNFYLVVIYIWICFSGHFYYVTLPCSKDWDRICGWWKTLSAVILDLSWSYEVNSSIKSSGGMKTRQGKDTPGPEFNIPGPRSQLFVKCYTRSPQLAAEPMENAELNVSSSEGIWWVSKVLLYSSLEYIISFTIFTPKPHVVVTGGFCQCGWKMTEGFPRSLSLLCLKCHDYKEFYQIWTIIEAMQSLNKCRNVCIFSTNSNYLILFWNYIVNLNLSRLDKKHVAKIPYFCLLKGNKVQRRTNYRDDLLYECSLITCCIITHTFYTTNVSLYSLNIQVEDVRIRAILATYRKRIPVTEGYVEVKDGGKWKQICNEDWTQMNSRVICGMFGFPGERKYNARVYKMFSRKRKHTYWDYSVNCTGNEAHLSSCKMGNSMVEKGNSTCQQGMPVVVSCVAGRAFAPSTMIGYRKAFRQEQPLVRLKGGAIVGEGRVEVLKNGEWGTICDDNWNLLTATVVCRELGFGSAKEALSGARLGQGMGPVHMNEVECSGFEKSITECFFNKDSLGCSHEEDAGVRCNVPAMGFEGRLRLSGGRNPFEGRVEVLAERNGSLVWGTVCSDGWGTMEAMVVCRQLGLGFANHAFQETWYWPGEVSADDVVMSGVKCSGTEMSLSHCLHDGQNLNCPKGGARFAAGVSCSETAPDLVLNPQAVEQTTYLEDRPMFMLQCAHEENCLASSANNAPANAYRRLLRFSSQIHNNGQSDFRPKAGRHSWIWHDCHAPLLPESIWDSRTRAGIHKRYECANFGEQGITVGCWDTYRHDIDCQWVDITDVKPGDYIFQVVINPNYEVAESDFTNNIMKCRCRYDGHRIWMYSCHIGKSLDTKKNSIFL
ncbi:LOL2B oxidase, partial [Atractosteus spatula]|nr:LOL2B oxidase [Atractosteus spatula]